jgi:hybrid polyketide synthase/nonribosomal peptide synthetase ACE1
MPSSSAQAALIRQTYAKAGLDPRQESDRCQYFEAHGTGTKAGDPREAGAIHEAFFGNRTHDGTSDPDDVLYVGSIKTVVGHTEGTAGIAGLIKASLAIQNATIPPNLLFSKLNPEIEPFYTHLQIPTSAKPWPTLADGNVRRASVNSFGFGGTNAHAIIELYDPVSYQSQPASSSVIPYVLSASSERSLVANVKSHMSFLLENPEVDLDAATWTLTKRSTHNYRISFAGLTPETLCEKMQQAIEDKEARNILMGTRPSTKGRGFLGVFTGQGAQWASASSKLIQSSPTAKATILKLEKSLSDLPVGDRPDWSLEAELMAQEPESRIAEGRMSQPLCTAIQIILVDLLKSAGITFSAVVGHSSGEIGAAYAAGYISASDAIRIAYYRGLYVCLARGPGGQKGAMVAVGTSPEDANDLCQLRRLRGKLQLAACNSNASVTLSGDDEAVDLAVRIFKDEGKFARKLKVDTAYHSHHMEPCGEVYVSALQACQIELLSPTGPECRWYSSVQTGRLMDEQCEELADTYWRDNMLKPVYFAQALSEALDDGEAPSVVLEVGPHPALKGPAGQIIQDVLNVELPYTGVLSRGKNDIEAFAEGLGFVWANSSAATVNFDGFSNEFTDHSKPNRQILKTLPLYAWDHSRTHWFETRMSRTQRLRKDRPHSLLGVHTSDETENELRWRNYIKPKELPWLEGHKIQGQLLFPGSGFAVMALEAACTLAPRSEIQTVLIDSFTIHRALSFANEDDGAETMFVLSSIERTSDYITASFVLSACLNANTGAFTSMASGSLSVSLGAPSPSALPSRPKQAVGLRHVDTEEFYNDLSRIGYNYSDMFKGIVRLERKADACSGVIVCQGTSEKDLMLHPAPFDVGFQAAFAALGAPGDGRLWALHIPTHIDKIRFNPHANVKDGAVGGEVPFDAYITDSESYEIVSDIELYDVTGVHCLLQVEGLHVSPLSTATSATDRAMFAEMEYAHDQPDASTLKATRVHADPRALEGLFPERCMLFYLKQVYDQITPEERETFDEHRVSIYNWAAYLVDLVSKNQHPHLRTEWLNDTIDILRPQMDE